MEDFNEKKPLTEKELKIKKAEELQKIKEENFTNFTNKVLENKNLILNGPPMELDKYNDYIDLIKELLDVDEEEFENSLSKGRDLPELAGLKRFITSLENNTDPLRYIDEVPNFFKIKK